MSILALLCLIVNCKAEVLVVWLEPPNIDFPLMKKWQDDYFLGQKVITKVMEFIEVMMCFVNDLVGALTHVREREDH